MLRQLLISLVVLAAAIAAFVFFVPGAPAFLAKIGINLPVAEAATPQVAATPGGNAQGGAQQRGGGQGGGAQGGGAAQGAGGQGGGGAQGGGGGQFGGRGGGAARQMVVVTAAVVLGKINDKLTAIGEGAAAHSVTVMSPASGTLAELSVRPGDVVKAGDVIGHLDADAEQIAFQQKTLAAQDAEAALTRTKELQKANNATGVQLNAAQLAASNAELALQQADLDLKKRTISSPIGGIVGLFQVNPGNTVSPQSVVTTIEDTSHILVSFWVPERYSSVVAPGMSLVAEAVALPGLDIPGTVTAVDNRIDPESRTLQVEAEIANDDGKLKPGMSYSVSMNFPGEDFPTVDPLSIQWSADGAYLWKYADGKVSKLPVEIIQRNSDGVLVKGDLKEGDQVVTQGVQQLTAGASVRLLDDLANEAAGGGQGGNRGGNGAGSGQGQGGGQQRQGAAAAS